jgi:hypothetical protein
MAQAEPTARRGMTFPFFLTLVVFIAVLCDVWLGETEFIPSLAYRQQPYIAGGLIVFGVLLWLWVLSAARRRSTRFEGPVQVARGSNGALQPILATICIVSFVNLAYSHTIPKWLNAFTADRVSTETFVLAGAIEPSKRTCHLAPATAERFGDVKLCIPERLVDEVAAVPDRSLRITGPASWFGIESQRIDVAGILGASDVKELPVDEPAGGQTVEEILNDMIAADEPEPPTQTPPPRPRADKLGNDLGGS